MIRVRFAPSPTGYLHIGNARTALFTWLYARATRGTLVLRIEDTDRERSREEYVDGILRDLRWLGIDWGEGPDVGGPYAPYRESERLDIYREHADRLLSAGLAYHCFCTPEELEQRRSLARGSGGTALYDGRCRDLTPDRVERFRSEGRPASVRFRVPSETVVVDDLVYGRMTFDAGLIGDRIVMKADGMPTYHFGVVVDDALMKITHVIRGEGHISNTPLHVLLFRALGYGVPQFAHMAHTLGSDGGKLSKRHGAFSLAELRDMGYLPEAVANYVALLGWSPRKDTETFSLAEAIERFDVKDLSKASSRFDRAKLDFLGGHHLREADLDRLVDLAVPFLTKAGHIGEDTHVDRARLARIIDAVRPRLSRMGEIAEHVGVFFQAPDIDATAREALGGEESRAVLAAANERLEADSAEALVASAKAIQKQTGVKGKALYMPLRIALTGEEHGPELDLVAPILGTDECRRRLKAALEISQDSSRR